MSADPILSRLDAVRKTGAGRWRARCPLCEGTNATKLSIRERDDGGVLLHCFSCDASGPEVCAALDLDPSELFPRRVDDDKRRPRERRPFSAEDALRLIDFEINRAATLILACASDPDHFTPELRIELAAHANSVRTARIACGLREVQG